MELSHQQAIAMIQARADGLLNQNEQTALDNHLVECVECKFEAERLMNLERQLKTELQRRWPEKHASHNQINSLIQNINNQRRLHPMKSFSKYLSVLSWVGGVTMLLLVLTWGIYSLRPIKTNAPSGIATKDNSVEQTKPTGLNPDCKMEVYTVKAGDTLNQIADRFGTKPEKIRFTIGERPEKLSVGLELLIEVCSPLETTDKIQAPEQLTPTPDKQVPSVQAALFPNATFLLPQDLPESPPSVTLYKLKFPAALTQGNANLWAGKLGISGIISQMPSEDPSMPVIEISNGYSNIRFLGLDGQFIFTPDYPNILDDHGDLLPFEKQTDSAISFLEPLGLLNQPYRVEVMSGERMGVEFVPLIDEHPVTYGIGTNRNLLEWINTTIKSDGSISQIGYSPQEFEPIRDVAILSAREAWERFKNAENFNRMRYAVLAPQAVTYQTWQRKYPLNQPVNLYGYITKNISIDQGSYLARINNWTISNQGMLPTPINPWDFIHAWGEFVDETQDGIHFRVDGWEISPAKDDFYIGTIVRQAEITSLETTDSSGSSLTLQLPDFPIEITDGSTVEIRGVRNPNKPELLEWWLANTGEFPSTYGASLSCLGGGGGGGGGNGSRIDANFGAGVFSTVDVTGSQEVDSGNNSSPPTGYPEPGTVIEGVEGIVTVTKFSTPTGASLLDVNFSAFTNAGQDQHHIFSLEGEALNGIESQQNLPIRIWGTVKGVREGIIVLLLDRYEAVYPDIQLAAYQGQQEVVTLEGRQVILLTTSSGTNYVLESSTKIPEEYILDSLLPGETVEIEGYVQPGTQYGGYQILVDISGETPGDGIVSSAIPFDGEMMPGNQMAAEIMAGQVQIESVELAYAAISLERCTPASQLYPELDEWLVVQPVWIFKGSFEDGRLMEIQVQALPDEYLK